MDPAGLLEVLRYAARAITEGDEWSGRGNSIQYSELTDRQYTRDRRQDLKTGPPMPLFFRQETAMPRIPLARTTQGETAIGTETYRRIALCRATLKADPECSGAQGLGFRMAWGGCADRTF